MHWRATDPEVLQDTKFSAICEQLCVHTDIHRENCLLLS